MFPDNAKKPTDQPNSSLNKQNIADPWQNSSPKPKKNSIPKTWNLFTQTTPLITSAGIPGAPKLPSHQSTSEEILLEDELKLKNSSSGLLKKQLEKALALLFWNKS